MKKTKTETFALFSLSTPTPSGPKGERGAVLLFIFLGMMLLAGIYASIHFMQLQQDQMRVRHVKKQTVGIKCKRAIQEVKAALEAEKTVAGKYPYEFSDSFLGRYKIIDRYIYNREIWRPEFNYTLKLDTAYGENYRLIGYCGDGLVYTYDSNNDKLTTGRYSPITP